MESLIKLTFNNLKKKYDEVEGVTHKWQRAQRREVAEINRLIKDMINNGVGKATTDPIKVMETNILGHYAEVAKQVKIAKKAVGDIGKNNQIVVGHCKNVYGTSSWKAGGDDNTPLNATNSGTGGLEEYLDSGKNLLVKVPNAIAEVTAEVQKLKDAIDIATNREQMAVTQTIALTEEIKKHWQV